MSDAVGLINNSIPAFGRSGKWNQMYVRNILRSRAPIGHLETRHGMIEDVFPVIVDPDDWLRVEAVRKARKGSGGAKTGAFVNLFAGSTACAKCGGNMRINTHARSGYRYYECTSHAVFKWCDNKSRYRVDRIEKEVLGDLGWLSVSIPPASPDDLPALSANLETLLAREHRLEKRFQELDDDTLFDVIAWQLRELRVAVPDARAHLASAKRVAAVAKADIPSIQGLTDRSEIHTALKARIKRVAFCDDREVLVETPGILLMISHKGDSVMVVAGADDKVAFISQGKVTFGAGFPGMPKPDPGLGAEFLKQLNAPGPVQDGLNRAFARRCCRGRPCNCSEQRRTGVAVTPELSRHRPISFTKANLKGNFARRGRLMALAREWSVRNHARSNVCTRRRG